MRQIGLLIVFAVISQVVVAQTLNVSVQNQNKQPIAHANILVNNKNVGYVNVNGQITLDLSTYQAPYRIQASYIGYSTSTKTITALGTQDSLIFELSDKNKLDQVVVTAGRKPEHLSTVPSSITILTEKEVQAQSQINNNLSNILGATVPGLGTATNKATNSGQTLRGRAVLVLIDGIPQSTPLMNGARDIRTIDPNVIERVEVIKGATSIYGNGSAGGIINYITKKSPEESKLIQGISSVRVGNNPLHSDETMGYKFSQLLYGRKNKFSYTLSGSTDYTGLQRDADGLPLGQTDGLSNSYQNNAFIKLGYDIDSTSSIVASYNYYNSNQHAKYISQTGKYDLNPTIGIKGVDPGKPTGTPYNHNAMINYNKSGIFGESSLQATLYYNTFRSMNRYVEKGTAWFGPGQTQINSEKKGVRLNLNTPFQIFKSAAELTYGLDLLNDVTDQDLTDGRVYIPHMNMFNLAPYAQLRLDIVENLILKGGVRYENATVKIDDFNTIASGPNNEGSIAVKGAKIPYKGATFNAGLRFNKYEIFNPFVSFSQGFAINELGRIVRRATDSDLDSIKTDPIITNNYEIGFSSHYSIFNLTAAYYYSDSKLGVELVDQGNGILVAQRLPEVVQGYEIALDARLNKTWTVGATYAYVEGKSEQDNGTKTYLNGSRIAPSKATAYLYYSPNDKLNLQLHWLYTGSRDRFAVNDKGVYKSSEGSVSSVSMFNLAGSYQFNQKWSMGLGVENLFNKDYYPVVSQYRALDAEYVKGTGTTASLTLNYKF
ncbi:TonB-dependent receptor [Sphingobacterium sp. DK4209]|uniref:TonB-dependent receptor n=1 Tax=Sphingobacterium zhuxiongii TaxID=2662364 RepID=A0A5Q0QFC3_9SPHI|nr:MULTISPECIES: TonB-dependent receptor [unclassified Sphingobacterium]MVZ64562.1 TonB-dependent receptor [Sphingobacterium sp. DK4209]QGA25890.1 TonB-dependent receptor [Sphingobacterium sp. dk4302]